MGHPALNLQKHPWNQHLLEASLDQHDSRQRLIRLHPLSLQLPLLPHAIPPRKEQLRMAYQRYQDLQRYQHRTKVHQSVCQIREDEYQSLQQLELMDQPKHLQLPATVHTQ